MTPRWMILLAILALAMLVSCQTSVPSMGGGGSPPTPTGLDAERADCEKNLPDTDKKKPEVCIGNPAGPILVYPYKVEAYRKSNGNPVKIKWVAWPKGATLELKINDPGCVVNKICDKANGNCDAETDTSTSGHYECKYTVILDGVQYDPLIIIDD